MQCSPQELKETLLKHLDNDFNVVDMQGMLNIMAVLEKYPITKENLEQTRIGKYVNDMRRKTENRELARRAKDLVRKWQQLVSLSSSAKPVFSSGETSRSSVPNEQSKRYQATVGTANGIKVLPVVTRPENGLCSKLSSPADSVSSAQSGLVANAANRSRLGPDRAIRSGSQPTTPVTVGLQTLPSVTTLSLATAQGASGSVIRPTSSLAKLSSERCSTPVENAAKSRVNSASFPVANGIDKIEESNRLHTKESSKKPIQKPVAVANGTLSPSRTYTSSNGLWSMHQSKQINGKTCAFGAVAEQTVTESVQPLPVLKIKINRTSASGSVSSPVAETVSASGARKTPKVETTAQLLKKLHANGELNLVASETVERIAKNQIKHEADDTPQSVVPEGAKPRPHKRRRTDIMASIVTTEPPRMTDADLLQVKAERVRNFVQMTCDAAAPPVDHDMLGLHCTERNSTSTCFGNTEPPMMSSRPSGTGLSVHEKELCADSTAAVVLLPELPVIDESSINWSSNDYVVPDVRPAPTEADVNRLHFDKWDGVSGQRDYRGEWDDWTRSYSARTYSGDLLHILPYVDLTD